jgi:hypothetical protein
LLHRERPAVAGLTLAPQAFRLSLCPTRKEDSDSFVSGVFSRIMISVMAGATVGAIPEAVRERKLLMTMATIRTQLRRREPMINGNEVSVAPSGFVFDLPEGFTMRGVMNRLGRLGFRHAIQVQRLARNCAVFFDDRSREFMSEAGADFGGRSARAKILRSTQLSSRTRPR